MTSTEALEVEDIPENLLVVGGGYIGMELGTVYATLGSKVVLVEALDGILLGADPDLARPVVAYAKKNFKEVRLKTKVAQNGHQRQTDQSRDGTSKGKKNEELYDRVLVAVGRAPNCEDLGLENTKVSRDDKGLHQGQRQAADRRPGDLRDRRHRRRRVAGAQGVREARVAVEVIMGEDSAFVGCGDPGGGVHRSGNCLVRFDRSRGQGRRASTSQWRSSRGRLRAARCRSTARTA